METHIKKVMRGSGTSSRIVVFTHDGYGKDGKPAVLYDPQIKVWSIESDQPLTERDFGLVKGAIKAMEELTAIVEAIIASEKAG